MKKTPFIAFTALVALAGFSGTLGGASFIGDPVPMMLNGLDSTASVAYGGSSGFYVVDDSNNVIQHYSGGGSLVGTIAAASAGGASSAFASPAGLQVDGQGDLWVADTNDDRVVELDPSGAQLAVLGTGGGPGQLSSPNGVALGPQDRVYVADSGNNRIAVYDMVSGAFLFSFGTYGFGADPTWMVSPMAVCVSGDRVYVADPGNARVSVFDLSGNYQLTIGGRGVGEGGFDSPFGVTVDGQGRVWVADNGGMNVQIFTESGTFIAGVGAGFDKVDFEDLTALNVEPDGTVIASDGYADRIFVWNSSVTGMISSPKARAILANAPLTVGPVPAKAGQPLQLVLPAPADKVTWQLFTADMRLAGEVQALSQSHVSYAMTSQLAAGVYLAKVTVEENGVERQSLQKIVITR